MISVQEKTGSTGKTQPVAVPGKYVLASLFTIVGLVVGLLVLWTKATPTVANLRERQPGEAVQGLLSK